MFDIHVLSPVHGLTVYTYGFNAVHKLCYNTHPAHATCIFDL